jgi:general stress protein 26
MHTPRELQQKFWKALKSDRTLMLGVDGVEDGHSRPMTAVIEGDSGPIWLLTRQPKAVVDNHGQNRRAMAALASNGHDQLASIQGNHKLDNDRAVIDRLWNPFIAAWFEGKDDPKLALLRFDAEHAEIWLNESNLLAGVKMLLGVDPKEDYKDNVAKVDLS